MKMDKSNLKMDNVMSKSSVSASKQLFSWALGTRSMTVFLPTSVAFLFEVSSFSFILRKYSESTLLEIGCLLIRSCLSLDVCLKISLGTVSLTFTPK